MRAAPCLGLRVSDALCEPTTVKYENCETRLRQKPGVVVRSNQYSSEYRVSQELLNMNADTPEDFLFSTYHHCNAMT